MAHLILGIILIGIGSYHVYLYGRDDRAVEIRVVPKEPDDSGFYLKQEEMFKEHRETMDA